MLVCMCARVCMRSSVLTDVKSDKYASISPICYSHYTIPEMLLNYSGRNQTEAPLCGRLCRIRSFGA